MQLLNQLLWKGKNKWQIIGATIGSFLGLFLLLAALQLYLDLQELVGGKGSGDQYVLINKRVNLMNTLGASSSFTAEEIEKIRTQSFIQDVGAFTPNQFKVSASSQVLGFYTELFFESVDDKFIDTKINGWGWKEGQEELPVILSRDYLALYNFGFAPSQGLPQFTPSTIRRVSVDITLKGNGARKVYQGRIVGFSDRINSILVPKAFMEWNNRRFGSNSNPSSSRLILKTDNPYSTELKDFLKDNNFEVSSGKLIGGQIMAVLSNVITIIAFIGGIIVLLSILIFILNFQLIISQSKEDIRLLLQLGYKTKQIQDLLNRVLFYLFGGILVLTFLFLILSRWSLVSWVETQGFQISGGLHLAVYVAAISFALLFIWINVRSIKSSIERLF